MESARMALIGKLIDKLLKSGRITIISPDGSRETYGPGRGKHLTIRLADRKVGFEILKNPRLGLGEAYMNGRLTVEDGTILELLELITGSVRWEDGGKGKVIGKGKLAAIKALFRRNPTHKARRNVAHHYDLSDELYDAFLDPDRQYSCAYYTDPRNSLEQAQADKKAHIAAKLYLKPGQKVLDIGCGWGGMALYLNRVADVDVLGITLSEEQLKVARRRAEQAGVSDRVRFELIDYRLLGGEFDRIVSVGMFEHVGLAHYDEFFAKCRALLKHDGVMLLHTIGKIGKPAKSPDPFTDKYIFPGYHLPSLSQMSTASEGVRLIASDVETLRLHYAYTLREWMRRFTAARAKMVELYDERFFRMWEFYLAGGIVMFETGGGCNYQVQYIRDRNALPITRDYMAEAEERYRKAGTAPAKKPATRKARQPRRAEAPEPVK
jgi:cyclopropane-fatty-acyl-phospholipid synthase